MKALVEKWSRIRELRRVVTGALEIARRDKVIGASLEAAPVLYVEDERDAALFGDLDLAEIAITSAARIVRGKAPDGAFTLPDVPGSGRGFRARCGEKMRALLDDSAGSWRGRGIHGFVPALRGRGQNRDGRITLCVPANVRRRTGARGDVKELWHRPPVDFS